MIYEVLLERDDRILGRLVRGPQLTYTQGGMAVTKFTIATNRIKKDEVDFINITVWGKQAEFVANYLSKGKLVGVEGRIQTGSYTNKEGQKVYTTDILADNVEFLERSDKKEDIPERRIKMANEIHDLKILPKYFDLVKRGIKNFEVRKNDRDFKVGDMLELLEWDEKEYKYTGRNERRKIIYILNDTDYCKEGYVILGLDIWD